MHRRLKAVHLCPSTLLATTIVITSGIYKLPDGIQSQHLIAAIWKQKQESNWSLPRSCSLLEGEHLWLKYHSKRIWLVNKQLPSQMFPSRLRLNRKQKKPRTTVCATTREYSLTRPRTFRLKAFVAFSITKISQAIGSNPGSNLPLRGCFPKKRVIPMAK